MIINHTQDMFFTLNGGVASWKSLKQETTIDFTTKVKYISAFEAKKKVIQIKKFIIELGVVPSIVDSVAFYYDDNKIIALANEPRSH